MMTQQQKDIISRKVERYEQVLGESEPYITRFLNMQADFFDLVDAIDWCIQNKTIIRFYPQADKVLIDGYIPKEKMWDIF
jgi:hypothetical protein